MARKREFDFDQAVEKATRLFWSKGYSNTSLRDLLKVMKIGESSFYNIVKGKKELYLECLKHYNDTVTQRRWNAIVSEPSIRAGVRHFFKMILDDLEDPKVPNVCLMAGSLANDVLSAKDLGTYVVQEMKTLEAAVAERFEKARQQGELPKEFDSKIAAQIFITYLQGFHRVVRVLKNRSEMERQVEAFLKGIGL